MLSRGWESASLSEVRAYKYQLTGTNHKHWLAKLNPIIREWDDLESNEMMSILSMLQSKVGYDKMPKATTKKSVTQTKYYLEFSRKEEKDR